VAAHLDTEILLVDEVLAVGDLAFQKKCLNKMSTVAEAGRTVLFVSHNMGLIQSLCQRGVFINNGHVEKDGPTNEVVLEYIKRIESLSAQPLMERKTRRGAGQARLVHAHLEDHSGQKKAIFRSGDPIRFVFDVDQVLPRTRLTFGIFDSMGMPVVHFESRVHSPNDANDPTLCNRFICEIDELMLRPHRYRVDAWLSGDFQAQDAVEGVLYFDVAEGLLDKRPINQHNRSRAIMPHRWILPNETRE
jgi:lipopolysaccharide transport system ATP-binding protein